MNASTAVITAGDSRLLATTWLTWLSVHPNFNAHSDWSISALESAVFQRRTNGADSDNGFFRVRGMAARIHWLRDTSYGEPLTVSGVHERDTKRLVYFSQGTF